MDPQASLKEMARVLVCGGYMLFYLCAYDLPKWMSGVLGLLNPRHSHHFNTAELVSAIKENGFEIYSYNEVKEARNQLFAIIKKLVTFNIPWPEPVIVNAIFRRRFLHVLAQKIG